MKTYILLLFCSVSLLSEMSAEDSYEKDYLKKLIGNCDFDLWPNRALGYMNVSESYTQAFCDQIIELTQEKGSLQLDTFFEQEDIPNIILTICADRCPGFAEKLNNILPGQDSILLPASEDLPKEGYFVFDMATMSWKAKDSVDYNAFEAPSLVKLMATRPELIKDLVALAEHHLRPLNDA